MIAEFYGLPGSGKTTLVGVLTEDENSSIKKNRQGKSISGLQHLCNAVTFEFLGFAWSSAALLRAKKSKWKNDGQCLKSMLRLYLIYMWERKNGGAEYRCYDHGIVQCILSLIWTEYDLREKGLALAEKFCANMKDGVRLIYTRIPDPDTVYERMVQRGESRRVLRLLNREQAMELLRFQETFFEGTRMIAEKYNMGVCVSTLDSVEQNAAELQRALVPGKEER